MLNLSKNGFINFENNIGSTNPTGFLTFHFTKLSMNNFSKYLNLHDFITFEENFENNIGSSSLGANPTGFSFYKFINEHFFSKYLNSHVKN